MEPVGELDDDDADVVRHREEHLPEILEEIFLLRPAELDLAELGDAVDEVGDFAAESLPDVGERPLGILRHVMEEGGGDGRRIHADLGEDFRDRDRVRDVGFAGLPELSRVCLVRIRERALDEFPFVGGIHPASGREDVGGGDFRLRFRFHIHGASIRAGILFPQGMIRCPAGGIVPGIFHMMRRSRGFPFTLTDATELH